MIMGNGRAPCCDKTKVKRGPWSPSEDAILISFINKHGHTNWRALPKQAGLLRCGKSCRLRWINYLRPDVKRGNFTPQEEQTIINLHTTFGNKWSKIAARLPGRTDNEIKNVWNTHIKKKLYPNSTTGNRTGSDEPPPPPSSSSSSSSVVTSSSEVQILAGIATNHTPSPTSSCHVTNPEIEIPFESGIDFSELLDWCLETGAKEDDWSSGSDLAEKLRLLEDELGLTPIVAQQVPDRELEIDPQWDCFPLWPSSPVHFGI